MSGTLRPIRTQDEFDQLLATSTRPVLVDVSATWCAPCQELTPILEDFAASQDAVEVVTVDADDPRALSWRLGGGTIPRMFLFDRGVLQMQVAGVRSRAWLDDVVAGYPSLGITDPDGVSLPERSAARQVELPAPTTGTVILMVIHGHDNGFSTDAIAPGTVDVTADSITILNITTETIESGYLGLLDPEAIDHIRVGGVLEGKHIDQIAQLTQLQCLHGIAVDMALLQEKAKALEEAGQEVDFAALMAEAPVQLSPEALEPLAALPLLRQCDVAGLTDLSSVLPGLIGGWWLAPGVAAARSAAGLPEHRADDEHDVQPVSTGCLLTRTEDGRLQLKVNLTIAKGWYAYPPGSAEGVPVSITVTSAHQVVEPVRPEHDTEHLTGRASLLAVLEGDDDVVRVDVRAQVCDGNTCLAPTTTSLVVPLTKK